MMIKNDQEIFDFFTKNLALAKQEFQNRVKESEIYKAIKVELDKYVRVPEPIFPSAEFMKENGWSEETPIKFNKNFYEIQPTISLRDNTYLIDLNQYSNTIRVFNGQINTGEEFLMLEKMLGIC